MISVDIDTDITETFSLWLEMVGSTVQEIGDYNEIFKKATSLLNNNRELYYSCVCKEETKGQLIDALKDTSYIIADYQRLEKYGLVLIVCKIIKV